MPVNRVLLCISFLVFFTVLPTGEVNAQEQILDDFETPGGWKIIVSDGVTLNIAWYIKTHPKHTTLIQPYNPLSANLIKMVIL